MNWRVLLIGSALTLPVLIFLGIAFRFNPNAIDSPLVGKPAPEFVLTDLDGNTVSSAALAGQPVVLNFWATWCQPCLYEHPVFVDGARRYEGRVKFVGVVYQDEPASIRRFIAQRGGWGPALLDRDSKVAIAYGVYGVPETFFIDRHGTIVEKLAQPVDRATLDRLLGAML